MSLKGRERSVDVQKKLGEGDMLVKYSDALNPFFDVEGFISLRDQMTTPPPKHLPPAIEAAFKEGAACMAIECFNAGATMFRLCLDLASRPLLPEPSNAAVPQPTSSQRRNLGPRLTWLFDNGKLPADLRGLASAVKDEGNDGAHAGSLTKADAEDLLDFTVAFLERQFTEPKKLQLVEQRRSQRRQPKRPVG
jgi:hypothetical protein